MMTTWTLTAVVNSTGATRAVDGHADDHHGALRAVTAAARSAVAGVHGTDDLTTYVLAIDQQTISILSTGRDSHGKPDRHALLAALDQLEGRSTT
ncbi:hypothetical protein ACQPXH_00500 [Nocardia sp. CA-135953]|uniref:hypothetical protein n=1 Tax=Nocardia sp. CA-135953 TaxID=3239978 RepID=UPI003D993105